MEQHIRQIIHTILGQCTRKLNLISCSSCQNPFDPDVEAIKFKLSPKKLLTERLREGDFFLALKEIFELQMISLISSLFKNLQFAKYKLLPSVR